MLLPVATIAALLTVFAVLAWQVRSGGAVTACDTWVREHAKARHGSPLRAYAEIAAEAGMAPLALGVLAFGAAGLAWRRHTWDPLVRALASGALLAATVPALKWWFARPGPFTASGTAGFGGYFPSGHTALAVVCYGTLVLLLRSGRGWRTWAACVTGLIALVVGAGLVLRGYHWVSDVLAAYTLSGAILTAVFGLSQTRETRPAHRPDGYRVHDTS